VRVRGGDEELIAIYNNQPNFQMSLKRQSQAKRAQQHSGWTLVLWSRSVFLFHTQLSTLIYIQKYECMTLQDSQEKKKADTRYHSHPWRLTVDSEQLIRLFFSGTYRSKLYFNRET
jgi:hypothetical protein